MMSMLISIKFFSVAKISELLRSPQRRSRVAVQNQEMIVEKEMFLDVDGKQVVMEMTTNPMKGFVMYYMYLWTKSGVWDEDATRILARMSATCPQQVGEDPREDVTTRMLREKWTRGI